MISLRDNIKFLQIFVFYKYENNIYLYIWFIYSLLIFFFFFFFSKWTTDTNIDDSYYTRLVI